MDNAFLENYIRLEKLCNDMYQDNHGISRYLEELEPLVGSDFQWRSVYRRLKEIRWKRNQLVHEAKTLYDEGDIEWLAEFYDQILAGEDPLSIRHKRSAKVVSRKEQESRPAEAGTETVLVILKIIVAILVVIIAACLLKL